MDRWGINKVSMLAPLLIRPLAIYHTCSAHFSLALTPPRHRSRLLSQLIQVDALNAVFHTTVCLASAVAHELDAAALVDAATRLVSEYPPLGAR